MLLAVSDNEDVDRAGGGSHWSLLAFDRRSNAFWHVDSAPGGGRNRGAARMLAGALSPLVRDRRAAAAGGGVEVRHPAFEEVEGAPRQDNGYDCGVYVMACARAVCESWSADPAGLAAALPRLREAVTPAAVAALRREALGLIRDLAAAGG